MSGISGMLALTQIVPGAFHVSRVNLRLSVLDQNGRVPWKPGLSIVGLDHEGECLSDGTEGNTYRGYEYLEKWDDRLGYTLFSYADFQNAVFNRAQITPVIVGHARLTGSNEVRVPEYVAVSDDVILAGCRVNEGDLPFTCPQGTFFPRLLSGTFHGSFFHNRDKETVSFKPSAPLSRKTWRELGYWIYTAEEETTLAAVKIFSSRSRVNGDAILLPASHVEELHGFQVGEPDSASDEDIPHLYFRSFVVTDPEKASTIWKYAAQVEPGTTVSVAESRKKTIFPDEQTRKACIPFTGSVVFSSYSNVFGLPVATLSPKTGQPIVGHLYAHGYLPAVSCTSEDLASLLVPAAKLPAGYDTTGVEGCTVFIGKRKQAGLFYYMPALNQPGAPSPKAQELQRRQDELLAKHGVSELPQRWEDHDDRWVEREIKSRRLISEGWSDATVLAKSLGLGSRVDALLTWLNQTGHPTYKEHTQTLYAPVDFDTLSAHPDFIDLLVKIAGDNMRFFAQAFMKDEIRAAVLGELIAQ